MIDHWNNKTHFHTKEIQDGDQEAGFNIPQQRQLTRQQTGPVMILHVAQVDCNLHHKHEALGLLVSSNTLTDIAIYTTSYQYIDNSIVNISYIRI
jgi:hypothetical protein